MPVFANENLMTNKNKDSSNAPEEFDEESEEDMDDYTIKKTDALILTGKIVECVTYQEDEFSQLEIYIYEEKTGNLYVHHDVMLSAFPICLEWLAVEPSSFTQAECDRANLAIVGSFLPHIEIWDLDTLDVIEPKMVLAGVEEKPTGPARKKKGKKAVSAEQGHSGAVISLNLNKVRKYVCTELKKHSRVEF